MRKMTYPLEILHEEKLGQAPKGDIVFVHGICHDARCWKNFVEFFSARGYRCSALSLRGHGGSGGRKRFPWFTLSDYVEDVEQAVAQCNTKPFLIGHSIGGGSAIHREACGPSAGSRAVRADNRSQNELVENFRLITPLRYV